MARAAHLAGRFVSSLRPGGPRPADAAWATAQLQPAEAALWSRMSGPDRRHAVGVARRVDAALGADATRPVLAAALLHDVGKIESGLRTYGRVIATLSAAVAGRHMAHVWRRQSGFARRVGLYLHHDAIGADLLELAGSDALTIAWAREHHLPRGEWSVPQHLGDALKAADDD